MKKNLLPILAFILAACATNTPAPAHVTVTSQVTVTSTATATPTLTPTLTITFTPTPELPSAIIADIESRFPGYSVEGNQIKDKAGNILPNLFIEPSADGKTWKGVLAPGYEFTRVDEDGNEITYIMGYESTFVANEFTLTKDGNLARPANEWDSVKKEWKRRTNIHVDSSGKEIDAGNYLYTEQEATQILLAETQKIIEKYKEECKVEGACVNGIPKEYFDQSESYMKKLLQPVKGKFPYNNIGYVLYKPKKGSGVVGAGTIFVVDKETNEYKPYLTTFHYWVSVGYSAKVSVTFVQNG